MTTANVANGEAAKVLSATDRPSHVACTGLFFDQPVSRVKGRLVDYNESVVSFMPLKRERIAKELSLFVDWSDREPALELKGLYHHGRVLYLPMVFCDAYGNRYNYLALKGIGMPRASEKGIEYGKPVDYNMGLESEDNSIDDWNNSNLFLRNGIRTTVPVSRIDLKSILSEKGNRRRVATALKERDISDKPVLYLKGFSEMARIIDVRDRGYGEIASVRGLGIREYARLLSQEVARNVALMHNLSRVHQYLHSQNITVDGCIVDLDMVYIDRTSHAVVKDVSEALDTIVKYSKLPDPDPLVFLESYFSNRKDVPGAQMRGLAEWLDDAFDSGDVERLTGVRHRAAEQVASQRTGLIGRLRGALSTLIRPSSA